MLNLQFEWHFQMPPTQSELWCVILNLQHLSDACAESSNSNVSSWAAVPSCVAAKCAETSGSTSP